MPQKENTEWIYYFVLVNSLSKRCIFPYEIAFLKCCEIFRKCAPGGESPFFHKVNVVTRPYSPPLLFMNLSRIHEVALPHTTSFTFFLARHQSLQKCSNESMKLLLAVSIQGNSSIKITICRLNTYFWT